MRSKKARVLALLLLPAMFVAAPSWPEPRSAPWAQADEPRRWAFPRDYGVHPQYRTEWWYFTGNLRGPRGEAYGYELTFFRQGLAPRPAVAGNAWSVRDLYLAHYALTDVSRQGFRFAERSSRTGPGLAAAAKDRLAVRVLGWSARQRGRQILLRARTSEMEIDLVLSPRKRPVLHGSAGLSRKGRGPGQASYYTSVTDLATRGTLRPRAEAPGVPVHGTSWFDHEFGSNQLSGEQEGWDWFGLHVGDGRDLMVYVLRRRGGGVEPASSGTLVEADGRARHLTFQELRIEALSSWKSPGSGATYPNRWRLSVPSEQVELTFAPVVAAQELATRASTGVVYWEGAVIGEGRSAGRTVQCEGYAELTGYAGSLAGKF